MSHGSRTGKGTESKGVQRIATRDLSVSRDAESFAPCLLSAQKRIETCLLEPAQFAFDSPGITGYLALFPQGGGFQTRRAGKPPPVEAGKSRPGSHLPSGGRILAHGTQAHGRTARCVAQQSAS